MKRFCVFFLILMLLAGLAACSAENALQNDIPASETPDAGDSVISKSDAALPDGGTVPAQIAWTKSIDFKAQYIRTNGYSDGETYPKMFWISSTEELEAYYELNREKYDLESRAEPDSDQTIGFADAVKNCCDEFFEKHDLLLVVLEEGSGSVRHEVTEVRLTPSMYDRVMYFIQPEIKRIVPETGTCDMAQWHIIIEVGKEYGMSAEIKAPIIR